MSIVGADGKSRNPADHAKILSNIAFAGLHGTDLKFFLAVFPQVDGERIAWGSTFPNVEGVRWFLKSMLAQLDTEVPEKVA